METAVHVGVVVLVIILEGSENFFGFCEVAALSK
jgi:hypothetical protein